MKLIDDEVGMASVEYVLVLGLVALGTALAVIGLGPVLVAKLRFVRAWLLLPIA